MPKMTKTARARPRKDSFRRIRNLGEGKVAALEQLLLKGYSPAKVAEVVQEDWGLSKDVKATSLAKQIERYRDREMGSQMAIYSENMTEDKRKLVLADAAADLEVMGEMKELVLAQKARVAKMLTREQDMPTNFSSLSSDIRLLKDLLNDLGKFQLETGAVKRASRTFDARFSVDDGNASQQRYLEEVQHNKELADATHNALSELGLLIEEDIEDGEFYEATDS